MTFEGKIHDGVVQLPGGMALPNGTVVTVVVGGATGEACMSDACLSDKEHARVVTIAQRIASLPDENPDDGFSGADHDRALYGES